MTTPPRLGRGVTITRRQVSDEEVYFLVKDPQTGSFFRMGEVEAAVLRLIDGSRSLPEVAEVIHQTRGLKIGLSAIEAFVATLVQRGLVESKELDPEAFRREWIEQQRSRRRTLGQMLGTLAYLKIHLFNPQTLFNRLVPHVGFFWSPLFVILTAPLMAVAGVMSVFHHKELLSSAHLFYVSATASGGALAQHAAIFYGVLFLVVAVHELAHGMTCAHFGGRVTDMGFILFYLQVPGMYCDITDAYAFERRSDRLWTTFAGSYTGLLLAALGFFAWWTSEVGDLANGLGIMLMFIGGPPALAFNWNPLLRLDGYYMLMDFLEAPNLMDNSYRYLGYLIKSRVLLVPAEPVTVPRRLRRAYIIYGISSILFLAPWIVSMPLVAYYIFSSLFGGILAAPIAAAIGWRVVGPLLAKAAATIRYAWQSHRPAALAGQRGGVRGALLAAGAAGALGLLVFGPRFAVRAHGIGVLEPMEKMEVRAAWPGFVSWSLQMPGEGDRVRQGDLLMRLENPQLESDLRDATLQAAALRCERATLEARGDPAGTAQRRSQERAAAERAAILSGHLEGLALKAPMAGVVLTPRLRDRAGTYLKAGDTWCLVGSLDRLRVRLRLTERDLGLIGDDSEAEVKGMHLPGEVFHGRVLRLPPGRRPPSPEPDSTRPPPVTASAMPLGGTDDLSVAGSLDLDVEVDNPAGLLRPGMSVGVRIFGERLTAAEHAARWARRLFKGKVWW